MAIGIFTFMGSCLFPSVAPKGVQFPQHAPDFFFGSFIGLGVTSASLCAFFPVEIGPE